MFHAPLIDELDTRGVVPQLYQDSPGHAHRAKIMYQSIMYRSINQSIGKRDSDRFFEKSKIDESRKNFSFVNLYLKYVKNQESEINQ